MFLLGALLAGDELRVAHCRDCSGVLVTDRLALRTPVCNECATVQVSRGRDAAAAALGHLGATLTARVGKFARVSIRPTLFSGPFLERRAELRDDPAWIAAARADAATRYLLAAGAAQLVATASPVEIAFLHGDHALVPARATPTSPC